MGCSGYVPPNGAPAQTSNLSGNLVADPGFELQGTNGVLSAPWEARGPAVTGTDHWPVGGGTPSNGPHSGTKDGYIYSPGTNNWTALQQTVSVSPNTAYTLTGWVQNSNNGAFSGAEFGVVTAEGAPLQQISLPPTSAYQQLTVNFNSGSNTSVIVYAGFTPQGASWLHLDDVSLQAVGNLVQDPGFELQGTNGVLSAPWAARGPAVMGVDHWPVGGGTPSNGPHSGTKDGYIYSPGSNSWSALQQTVAVAANTDYTLTGWLQNSDNSAFSGGEFGVAAAGGAPLKQTGISASSAYQQLTLSFNSGSNTSVIIYAGFTPQGASWLHLDDVSLVGGTSSCVPTTCSALGANCGSISDGCGGTLTCGSCSSPATCGGGGTPNVCGGGAPPPTGYFIATNGNDSNPGTIAAPFASFPRAQSAMRNSNIKTTYVRGGSYAPKDSGQCPANGADAAGCVVKLTAADNGQTWQYYPPDGYNSASITGGTKQGGYNSQNGLWSLFQITGAKNITVDGLTLHDFNGNAIQVSWSNAIVVQNNVVYNGYYNLWNAGDASALYGTNCDNCEVSHNVVHDIYGMGIRWYISTNLRIDGNAVYSTCTGTQDCGGIYYQDVPMTSTGVHISNNYVHDGNPAAAALSGAWGAGIYLDDCTSNVTVTGNVLTGRNGNNTTMIHGGSNNVFSGNLTDLSNYNHYYMAVQTTGACANNFGSVMSGNQYVDNIVIGDIGNMGAGNWAISPGRNPLNVSRNDFFGYNGTNVTGGGYYAPTNSVTQDPRLSCWAYDLASGSPVFAAPVSFPGLTQGWGPPGYSIPQTGTPPSSPGGC